MRTARLVPELVVSNLVATLDFYCRLIGFRVQYDRPENGFAYLEFCGAELMVEQSAESWLTGEIEKPYGRGVNLQIEVADTASILSRLLEADWPLFEPLADAWYRQENQEVGNRQFLVQDPDGYLLRFFKDLGKRQIST